MKQILFAGLFILFVSCSETSTFKDNEVVDVPFELQTGYGPFYAGFSSIGGREPDPESPWARTRVEMAGLPGWEQQVVDRIWFDGHQFAYQNYKQGNLDEGFFNELISGWNINLEDESLSEEPIKCFTHLVSGKDESGANIYKIDLDNDLDFSNDEVFHPSPIIWDKLDSLFQYAHRVQGETVYQNEVVQIEVPVMVLETENGSLLHNIALHGKSSFLDTTFHISNGFTNDLAFRGAASIILGDEGMNKSMETIELNEFITINDNLFQHLGIDFNRRMLKLKKMPTDTVLYSSQVGFAAKPFDAVNFQTGDAISLNDYQGKYLYLEFWGTWCGPCIAELPNLQAAYEETSRDQIDFLGVAEDRPKALSKFLEEKQLPWQQILADQENDLVNLYGIRAFPTSFLIDQDGRIVAKNLRGSALTDTLKHYLN